MSGRPNRANQVRRRAAKFRVKRTDLDRIQRRGQVHQEVRGARPLPQLCPVQEKKRFVSQDEAEYSRAWINSHRENYDLTGSYECRYCGDWHHTSQSDLVREAHERYGR